MEVDMQEVKSDIYSATLLVAALPHTNNTARLEPMPEMVEVAAGLAMIDWDRQVAVNSHSPGIVQAPARHPKNFKQRFNMQPVWQHMAPWVTEPP